MIRACLLMLAGGLAAQHSRLPVNSDLYAALFVAAALVFFVRRIRSLAFVPCGFLLFVVAGQDVVEKRLDPKFAGDSLLTVVRIVDFPRKNGPSVTMTIEAVSDDRVPSRSRVSWYEPTMVPSIGDVWQLELRLRRPRGHSNPGTFDLEAWMFREKIHASGYVVSGKRNRRLEIDSLSWLDRVRVEFVRRAQVASPNPETAAVLAAVGVGSRHLVTDAQWDRYAISGTSHLMAISGLHVGLAAGGAFFVTAVLLGVLRARGNHLDYAIITGLVFASIYALVSGLDVPARRAIIMLILVALASFGRRKPRPGIVISIAALLVFMLDPIASMAPGFNLSFAAVLVLMTFSQRLFRPREGAGRAARALNTVYALAAMQGALLFGLLPLTVLTFHRIAVAAPIANMLAVPIFSFVTVPATLMAMMFGQLSTLANDWLLRAAIAGIELTESLSRHLWTVQIFDVTPAGVTGAAWLLLLLTLAWVLLPVRWPGRWIAVLSLFALALHKPAGPPQSCFDAHILDVGQGLAVLVQTNNHTMLFDTGVAYRGGDSAAEQQVLPFLRHKGIDRLDWLVVSHADNDHAGGVEAIAANLSIGSVISGEALRVASLEVGRCSAGQSWQADGVDFRVLHPQVGAPFTGNDSSCVVEVSVGAQRLLLTGDIEAIAEASLLEHADVRSASVVVIPHHGSRSSSTPAFVDMARPSYAVAAVGYANRWGFPNGQVVRRWQESGALVLDTATSGALSFRFCDTGDVNVPRQHRLEQQRFWRDPPES